MNQGGIEPNTCPPKAVNNQRNIVTTLAGRARKELRQLKNYFEFREFLARGEPTFFEYLTEQ